MDTQNKTQREIKFRAWIPSRKFMGIAFGLKQRMNTMLGQFPDDAVLMQFTGLLDKNGTEIYEGDIVRFCFCADHPLATSLDQDADITEMIDEVRFTNGMFCFWNHDVGSGACACRFNDRCNIVGNIYENNYLLDKFEAMV